MLRSFRVANHRSLRDEQELLLMPQYGGQQAAVPVTAIFGGNASGKSNVLDALKFMQAAVRDSYQRWQPTGQIPRHPFRLGDDKLREPSWYVIETLINDVRWTYGFELDDDKVREEWLYTYPQQRKRVVFERDGGEIRFGSTVSQRRDRSRVLEDLTRDNALFLSLAAQVGLEEVMPMYSWLDQDLCFATADAVGEMAKFLISQPERMDEVLALIKAADLGISGLQLLTKAADGAQAAHQELVAAQDALASTAEHGDADRVAVAERLDRAMDAWVATGGPVTRLKLAHGGVPFDLQDESAGTKSWLALLPSTLEALSKGQTLIVDELDASIHPRLLARVIELFRSPETNTGGGQLLFTTHDATLLGTSLGIEVLRRDEIWFVEKGPDGDTSLFPLSDFKPRKGDNAERRYLGGSYGAVPAVFSDTLVDELLRSRERSDAAS